MFHTATESDLRAGLLTDVYFRRTVEILRAHGADRPVVMEITAGDLPKDWSWACLCGIEELAAVCHGVPVDVDAMPEGSLFFPGEPVARFSGKYTDFAELETAFLGLLCQASGIMTRASRCRAAAGDRLLLSFGARRMHPTLAPVIDRAAYLGGCEGFSVIKSEELLGASASGTMPHALVLLAGSLVQAMRWFDETEPEGVPRVALIDTLSDEKFEALAAAEALGDRLWGVRLDTPRSRRGDMLQILKEVRWELDLRGYRQIRLLVSGGLDEHDLPRLNPLAAGYGLGTSLANAPTVNLGMDIVEIEGQPMTKRGKRSGAKQVLACDQCQARETVPLGSLRIAHASQPAPLPDPAPCPCGGARTPLLRPLIRQGEPVPTPSTLAIRERCQDQLTRYLQAHPEIAWW